jgi:hypothetical protein
MWLKSYVTKYTFVPEITSDTYQYLSFLWSLEDVFTSLRLCLHIWDCRHKAFEYHFSYAVSRRAVLCDWVWRVAGIHTGFRTITLVLYIGSLPNLATWFPCGRGRTLFILGSLGQRSRSPLLWIEFLTTGLFPHDNFSSVYWIFTKLDHMIALYLFWGH